MKIGILTFHKAINYGAVTQCYALSKKLQEDFPNHDIEVIDYAPQWRINAYKPSLFRAIFSNIRVKNGLLLNFKIAIKKTFELLRYPSHYTDLKRRYDAFTRSMGCLPLSKERYRQNSLDEFRMCIKGKYDLIIVGSDCVWEWSTVPLPSPYYLTGDFGSLKASFAASVGTDDHMLLDVKQKMVLQESINDFSYIGVRDSSSEYVVRGVCKNRTIYHNCDPTTFLDLSKLGYYKTKAEERIRNAGIKNDKPIVCIMGNEKLGKLAREIFGDSVYYIGVYVPNQYCDVFFPDLEVLEWATIFGLCDLTFTTFFHGTMLSLVNLTPVISFDYLPETEKQITKLHELYDRLGLQEFYLRGKAMYNEYDVKEIGTLAKSLIKNPPKDKIKKALAEEAKSYNSLHDYLISLS